jgi:hypothetical protein
MPFRSLAVLSLFVAAISPSLVRAQDALPFSAGQWGLEGTASSSPEGGIMRFFSPGTALVLSGSYFKISSTDEQNDPFYGSFKVKSSQSVGFVRLGMRFFRPLATSLVQFTTVGITAQYINQNQDDPVSGVPLDGTFTNLGAFGEFGAQYHLATRFALGTAVRAEYLHLHGKTTGNGADLKTTGNGFSVDFIPIRASIFF